jgi:hypothetical protein
MTSGRSGFAAAVVFGAAAFCLGPGPARAQSVPYWISAWPAGFGAGFTSDAGANAYGNFSSRYNFENGWFVGSERGNLGFGANGFSPVSAFGVSAFTYEGAQAGYNFKSAPVSIYAGFDTLKYNTGTGNPLLAFDSTSSSYSPGYSVHAGVEFRPTSNLSLSVGVGFTQQPTDINSALLPGASPLAFGRR